MSPQQTTKKQGRTGQTATQSCPPGTSNTQTTANPQNTDQQIEHHKQEAKQQAEAIKRDTQQSAQSAKEQARQVKESAQQQTQEALEKGKQQLREQADRAKAEGASLVNKQKERVADEVSTFGSAFRDAAHRFHEEDDQAVAHYAEMAADQMDRLSHVLRDREPGRLLHDVEDMARSRPELVFGGLFVAGLGIARFLKASGSRRPRYSPPAQAYSPQAQGYSSPAQEYFPSAQGMY